MVPRKLHVSALVPHHDPGPPCLGIWVRCPHSTQRGIVPTFLTEEIVLGQVWEGLDRIPSWANGHLLGFLVGADSENKLLCRVAGVELFLLCCLPLSQGEVTGLDHSILSLLCFSLSNTQ